LKGDIRMIRFTDIARERLAKDALSSLGLTTVSFNGFRLTRLKYDELSIEFLKDDLPWAEYQNILFKDVGDTVTISGIRIFAEIMLG